MVTLFIARTRLRTIVTVSEARMVTYALPPLPVLRHRSMMMFVLMVMFRSKLTSRQTGELSELIVVRVPSFRKPLMTTELVAPQSRRSRPFRTSGIEKSRTSP